MIATATLQQDREFRCSRQSVAGINLLVALRIRGTFEQRSAQAALDALVARQEALRTSLRFHRGEVHQVIHDAVEAPLRPSDLRALSPKRRRRALQGLVQAALLEPFDLTRAPLIRGQAVRTGVHEHYLFWVVAHTIWDARSFGVFLRDFTFLYTADATESNERLPPVRRQPRELVAKASSSNVNSESPTGGREGYDLVAEPFALGPRSLAQTLFDGVRAAGGTLPGALLAGVAVVLASGSNMDDVVLGMAFANRDAAGAGDLVGCLFEVIPLRIELSGEPTFKSLASRASDLTRDARRHRRASTAISDPIGRPSTVMVNFVRDTKMSPRVVYAPQGCGILEEWRPEPRSCLFPMNGVWYGSQLDISVTHKLDDTLSGYVSFNRLTVAPERACAVAFMLSHFFRRAARFPDQSVGRIMRRVREDCQTRLGPIRHVIQPVFGPPPTLYGRLPR